MKDSHKSVFLNPLALMVLAAGCATSAITETWWLLPMAVAGYGIVTLNTWLGRNKATPPEPELVLPAGSKYARSIDELTSLQHRITRALEICPEYARKQLEAAPERIAELIAKSRKLANLLLRLDIYIKRTEEKKVRKEVDRIKRKMEGKTAKDVLERYEKALANKTQELEGIQKIKTNRERVEVELMNIKYALENTLSKVVNIQSADGELLPSASQEVTPILDEVLLEVESLEQTVEMEL